MHAVVEPMEVCPKERHLGVNPGWRSLEHCYGPEDCRSIR